MDTDEHGLGSWGRREFLELTLTEFACIRVIRVSSACKGKKEMARTPALFPNSKIRVYPCPSVVKDLPVLAVKQERPAALAEGGEFIGPRAPDFTE